jgi:hypothetical protein
MRAEEQALEKPVRKSTRHRNCSPIPTSRTQFQTEAELAQERLDAQLARQVQREEGLGAGLGARRAGDVSEDDADDEESPRKVCPKSMQIPPCFLTPYDRKTPRPHLARMLPRNEPVIELLAKVSIVL